MPIEVQITSTIPEEVFTVNTQPQFVTQLPSNLTFDLSESRDKIMRASLGEIADLENDAFTVVLPSVEEL